MKNLRSLLVSRYLIPEWEKQDFVQLVLPHKDSDWSCCFDEAINTFKEIAFSIAEHQKVLIVYQEDEVLESFKHDNFIFRKVESNDTWSRDFGAISIKEDNKLKLLDFKFNGWGLKFASNFDNNISRELFEALESYNFTLEGGGIDTNGESLLVTTECLMEKNRNYPLTQNEVEEFLKETFGVKEVIWIDNGYLAGDDTDSHIDTLARFVNKDTIVYMKCYDANDEHFEALNKMEDELKKTDFNLIPLPLPKAIYFEEERLPATYANFLIINKALLLPIYNDKYDDEVIKIFEAIFPEREIIAIDSNSLIKQHGSIHCVTKEYFEGSLEFLR
jgi:agmatine/peptidylarginine deiminase